MNNTDPEHLADIASRLGDWDASAKLSEAELERLAEEYALEQMAGANSGTDSINRHWRQA